MRSRNFGGQAQGSTPDAPYKEPLESSPWYTLLKILRGDYGMDVSQFPAKTLRRGWTNLITVEGSLARALSMYARLEMARPGLIHEDEVLDAWRMFALTEVRAKHRPARYQAIGEWQDLPPGVRRRIEGHEILSAWRDLVMLDPLKAVLFWIEHEDVAAQLIPASEIRDAWAAGVQVRPVRALRQLVGVPERLGPITVRCLRWSSPTRRWRRWG